MQSTLNRRIPASSPRVRRAAAGLLGLALLLSAPSAWAQFSNHGIGFQAGYMAIDRKVGASGGPVIGLESSIYVENGFEFSIRVLGGIHEEIVSGRNAIGFFPALGMRYLLVEDGLRPYLGANLAYMHFFGSDVLPTSLFSISPFAGLEYFISSGTAIGVQAEYQRILVLNGSGGNAFAGIARIAWGF